MLDTNVVSEMARNPQGRIAQQIVQLEPNAICISIITAAELRYGCIKKGSAKLSAQIEAILGVLELRAFGEPADAEYGAIRSELEVAGQPIGPNDLLIAAHARSLGATLVTANIREFKRVSGLHVENWQNF